MTLEKNNSHPTFSLVIPCYNLGDYLRPCLESIRAQIWEDFEVICIDDGSTDETPDVLATYEKLDGRFRVLCQENAGVSAARNAGIKAARGEYLLFIDGDDLVSPVLLERVAQTSGVLSENEHAADIVVFGGESFPTVAWIDEVMDTRDVVRSPEDGDDGFEVLFTERGCIPLMANKAYRLSFLRRLDVQFNEQLALGEDNAFQCMVFPEAECVVFISDKLYRYRCGREGSAMYDSSSDVASILSQHVRLLQYVLDVWHDRGYPKTASIRLLDAQLYLFNDEATLPPEAIACFCREFAAAFECELDEGGLTDLPSVEAKLRYRYFLDVAVLSRTHFVAAAVRRARMSRRMARVRRALSEKIGHRTF